MSQNDEIIWTRSRVIVRELMQKLDRTRELENTKPFKIPYDFGNLKDAQHARPPRIIWLNEGGLALQKVAAPAVEILNADGTTTKTTVPAIGYRLSKHTIRIWERDPEKAEVVLDQLVTSANMIDRPDAIVFQDAPWKFVTEVEGRWLENGFAMIDATCGIRSRVAASPIGSNTDVIVASAEFRAGIENPLHEPLDESEYDVDRITIQPEWPG